MNECHWCGELMTRDAKYCSTRCQARMRRALKREGCEVETLAAHPMDQWHWFTIPHIGAWNYTLLNPHQPHEIRGYQRRTFLHE